MKNLILILGLVSTLMWGPTAISMPITFDLNNGVFTTLPATGSQTSDYTGVYQSPTFNLAAPVTLSGGQTGIFDFHFNNGTNNQFIKLVDSSPTTLPNEGIIFTVTGTGTAGVNPVIRLTGATGSYRQDSSTSINVSNQTVDGYLGASESFSDGIRTGMFSSAFPNDPARFVGVPLDVTDQMLSFTGLQFELFNQGPNPITLNSLSFVAVANQVQISSSVPEPETWTLMGLGLAGIGFSRKRRANKV